MSRVTYDWTLAGATFEKNRGRVFSCFSGGGGWYSHQLLHTHKVPYTVTTHVRDTIVLYDQPRHLSDTELLKMSSWPRDYDFCGRRPDYVLGMSVPPLMIYGIASRILEQWSGVFK